MSNEELKAKVKEYLVDNKAKMLEGMAEKFNVNSLEIAQALPYELCGFANPENFEEIWKELCKWDKCLFLLIHLGTVLEISGKLGEGKHGSGYYNLHHDNGSCIAGHLKIDDIAGIAFMSIEMYSSVSKFISFINADGEVKFSVFAGRENRVIIPSVSESFEAMKEKYSTNKD